MVGMKKTNAFDVLIYSMLIITSLLVILPVFYVAVTSITTYEEFIRSNGLILFPKKVTFEGYNAFLTNHAVPKAYLTTVFLTVVGTLVNMLLTTLMAFPLSRKKLPGKKLLTLIVIIPLVFSGGLIPTYYVVKSMKLINSVWAMIIPSAIWSYNLVIMKSFFATIDESYIEAAKIDGANVWYILVKVVLPLSKPVLATLLLFYGVGHWNEYYAALYYVTDSSKYPLQVVLRSILASSMSMEATAESAISSHNLKMAAVVLTALPILVVYPFLQKYFTQGVLLGGVKG